MQAPRCLLLRFRRKEGGSSKENSRESKRGCFSRLGGGPDWSVIRSCLVWGDAPAAPGRDDAPWSNSRALASARWRAFSSTDSVSSMGSRRVKKAKYCWLGHRRSRGVRCHSVDHYHNHATEMRPGSRQSETKEKTARPRGAEAATGITSVGSAGPSVHQAFRPGMPLPPVQPPPRPPATAYV